MAYCGQDAESASYVVGQTVGTKSAKVVYNHNDSNEDYDPTFPPETRKDFEGIEDSD